MGSRDTREQAFARTRQFNAKKPAHAEVALGGSIVSRKIHQAKSNGTMFGEIRVQAPVQTRPTHARELVLARMALGRSGIVRGQLRQARISEATPWGIPVQAFARTRQMLVRETNLRPSRLTITLI
ncbi:hypothetical protein BB029_22265 [Pseudomonas sp. S3E12]|nr:hypothetical protein BB029_22265 [Pseudomonas sp. S3E12]